ncbi:hypothetical protein GBAR_LOCUS197 [Geodia barretti]|uniref:DUF3500 domain-containing protein n=1 Tax=Geodia barretti TaxID=519541 RepID=A0AA35W027_GEOBA|nr:hypothetical protein GBAR_LOCUS197 [Geodia barretti]
MSDAASAWMDSLDSEQRSKATFHYMDGERIFWYYPPLNRHGLPLRDMDGNQRNLALSLLATGLTDETNRQANLIIEHEEVLGPLEAESGHVTWPRDPELYYWTVFGDPTGSDPWGWRAEGHHLSVHYSVWGDQILAVTPFFLGANPAEVRKGPKLGQRILGQREDLAIELMASLDAGQRGKAIIHDNAPWDILGYNSSKQAIHNDEGLAARDLNGTQKEMLMTLISEYVGGVPEPVAADRMARIRDTGLDDYRLVWAGALDRSRDHYYRIHGGQFIVEFDNIQNGANHIHSVWRDVENDFAQDVLRDHHLLYHIL